MYAQSSCHHFKQISHLIHVSRGGSSYFSSHAGHTETSNPSDVVDTEEIAVEISATVVDTDAFEAFFF